MTFTRRAVQGTGTVSSYRTLGTDCTCDFCFPNIPHCQSNGVPYTNRGTKMGNLPRKHSQQRQTLVLSLSTSAGQDEPGGAAGTTNP